MNAPQILIIVLFFVGFIRTVLIDIQKGRNKLVDSKNFWPEFIGHMIGSLVFEFVRLGIIFGLLIWGNFFSSK